MVVQPKTDNQVRNILFAYRNSLFHIKGNKHTYRMEHKMDIETIKKVNKLVKDLEQLRKDLDNHISNTDKPHEAEKCSQ